VDLYSPKFGESGVIGLLQRVTSASVSVNGGIFSSIGPGLLVLIGVRPDDDESSARKLLSRILQYRVFGDDTGKMNLNLRQIDGELLLVPQFTLAADTRHGLRPGFSTAAPPDVAARLFDFLLNTARGEYPKVACGSFGANMQVSLVNDGPVTFWLDT
jgi:D-tyrosyl-tRNA(Tyr) deacylase